MSDELMKAHKSEASGNIIMPQMRMMYATLFKSGPPSKSVTDPKRFQWGITGLIPDGADLSALEEEINRIFESEVPEAKRKGLKWKYPLLETKEMGTLSQYADEYPLCIRPNAKEFTRAGQARPRPDVIDPRGRPVDEADETDEIYNGRWFRCSLNPYWYPANDGQPGISLGLVNVQLLKHDEPLAGGKVAGTSEFAAVEGLDDLEDEMAGLE